MTAIPLPGCCNSCCEPVTQRQKSVLFEGPNLRYPELGADTAVFHTRQTCRFDARGYDEAWAKAVPGRVQKFPGWLAGARLLKLMELTEDYGPEADRGVPVSLHLMGGPFDGACWNVSMPQEFREVLYTEPVPQPRKAEPGAWHEHAVDCPCRAAGSGQISEGDHIYRSKLAVET